MFIALLPIDFNAIVLKQRDGKQAQGWNTTTNEAATWSEIENKFETMCYSGVS
jgi:hypothetical protein